MNRIRAADRPDPTSIRWIIKRMVRARSVGILFGSSGVGKSTLQVDIACSVASLSTWRGLKVRGGPVAIIAAEDPDGVVMMLQAWEEEHNTEGPTQVDVLAGPFDFEDKLDDLIAELKAIRTEYGGLALVVIDTLAALWADESNEGMSLFLAACRRIADETGAAVLITHHVGHAERERERGGSALRCGVDLSVLVSRNGEVGVAEVLKVRGAKEGAQFGYALKPIELGTDEDGEAIDACVATEEKPPRKVRQLGTNAQIVLRAIVALNQIADFRGGIPLEMVRADAYRRMTCTNKSQAFQRALSELQKSPRYISVLDGKLTLSPDVSIPAELYRQWEDIAQQLH